MINLSVSEFRGLVHDVIIYKLSAMSRRSNLYL